MGSAPLILLRTGPRRSLRRGASLASASRSGPDGRAVLLASISSPLRNEALPLRTTGAGSSGLAKGSKRAGAAGLDSALGLRPRVGFSVASAAPVSLRIWPIRLFLVDRPVGFMPSALAIDASSSRSLPSSTWRSIAVEVSVIALPPVVSLRNDEIGGKTLTPRRPQLPAMRLRSRAKASANRTREGARAVAPGVSTLSPNSSEGKHDLQEPA